MKIACLRISFIVLAAYCLNSVELFAQAGDSAIVIKNGRKCYIYVVEAGNTLYSISRRFQLSVQEITSTNPGAENGLSIGDTLYILAVDQDKKTMEKKMEIDGNILVHEVQKGQTLYAISRIYGIGVADIVNENPEIEAGVKEGQLIRIPIAKLKKQETTTQNAREEKGDIVHVVGNRETLYSLSRYYRVPVDSIKNRNNGLPDGLKEGQEIVIPFISPGHGVMNDSTELKEEYRVGIILPFFLDLNDTLISRLKLDDEESVLTKSLVSIQFYEGAMIAFDSLQTVSRSFKLKVFDSSRDSNAVGNLLANNELRDADLIIGPFYQTQFLQVSAFAKANRVHIVSPVPQTNRILLGNPYVSKVATSRNILFKNLATYVSQYYRTENIILITQNFRANDLANTFKIQYMSSIEIRGDSLSNPLKEIKWDHGSIDVIKAELKEEVFNVIVVPSNDQVYVTELLSKLNNLHKDYLFKVVGTETWLKYTNIDFEYFENLNVMVPVDGFIDYDKPETQRFIRNYHQRYKVFPEKFAFLGFDVTYYYLGLLRESGTRIEQSLTSARGEYFYYKFNFFKTGIESGFENSSLRLLRYNDFKLEEVPVPE